MNLVRFDPFRELEAMSGQLNRLFAQPSVRADDADGFGGWMPAIDVQETDTEYLIKADLPEVAKADVKIGIQNGMLTIEGERRQEKEEKGKKMHRVERTYGRFVRRLVMPSDVVDTKVTAEFKDGVLHVRLPKSEAAKPKTVEVKVA